MGETVIPDPIQEQVIPDPLPASDAPPVGSIAAGPTGIKGWLGQLEGDVKYGSDVTMPGKLLKFLGAQGTQVGSQAGAGDTLASPITGPIHTAQGIADIPDHPLKGVLKAAGGALETASIPAAFMAPEGAKALSELPPSRPYASKLFQQLMSKLGSTKADISEPMAVAQKIVEAKEEGGQLPTVVRAFLRRVSQADAGLKESPNFKFIRGLYSNATRLSANEYNSLNPNTQRLVGEFTAALGKSAHSIADQAGMGNIYLEAMKNYRQGSQAVKALKTIGKVAVTGGAAGLADYYVRRAIESRK